MQDYKIRYLIVFVIILIMSCYIYYVYYVDTYIANQIHILKQEGFESKNHTRYNNSMIFLPQLLLSADPYVRTKIKRICNNPMFNPREHSLACKKQPCVT